MVFFLIGFFGWIFFNKQLGDLWPTGVFLIGDEIKRNESIESFRHGTVIFILTAYILPLLGRQILRLIKPKALLM